MNCDDSCDGDDDSSVSEHDDIEDTAAATDALAADMTTSCKTLVAADSNSEVERRDQILSESP